MRKVTLFLTGAVILVFALSNQSKAAVPQLISYQGFLTDGGGIPLSGTFQIAFTIYDDPVAGSTIWTENQPAVTVTAGSFIVLLGSATELIDTVFNETTRYLGIQVGGDPEISPRTRLVSNPFSYRVNTVDGASGGNITSKVSIGPGHTLTGVSATITGGHDNTASGLESTVSGGHSNTASDHDATVGGGFANSASAMAATIGGGSGNSAGGQYATVGGGQANSADTIYATVSGGVLNTVSGHYSVVGGGAVNTASGGYSTIAGGEANSASSAYATIGGGDNNTASDRSASILGGTRNLVAGRFSAILGGFADTITATADYSYLFGINSNLTADSTFMVDMPHVRFGDEATGFEFPTSDGASGQAMTTDGSGQLSWTTVGGGGGGWTDDGTVVRLDASADSVGIGTTTPSEKLDVVGNLIVSGKANIGPGNANAGLNAFVTGTSNSASGDYSTVGGGQGNVSSDRWSTVGGGQGNVSSYFWSTVGGGQDNTASAGHATVGGGVGNTASNEYTTVGGGNANTASGFNSTVGGGLNDTASGHWSTVGGGERNIASGERATVGGGGQNKARGLFSVVAGGGGTSTVDSNSAIGNFSSIGGGSKNIASGVSATVPGGYLNHAAGESSFAAGLRAKANHNGSFVWGDQTGADFASSAINQFSVRATGGTRIYSSSGLTTGVTLSAGGGAWVMVSDSTIKRNIRPVDEFDILEKIANLPISRWSYETQSPDIEHIGPMSQDFYAAFGLGEDEKGISTLDPDGVSLAAIKALYSKNKELNERLEKLEKMIDKLSNK